MAKNDLCDICGYDDIIRNVKKYTFLGRFNSLEEATITRNKAEDIYFKDYQYKTKEDYLYAD